MKTFDLKYLTAIIEALTRNQDLRAIKSRRVVLQLVQCVEEGKRNITGETFYSSVQHLEEMKKENLIYVGSLKNIEEPQNFCLI